jgi:hypothetical protein
MAAGLKPGASHMTHGKTTIRRTMPMIQVTNVWNPSSGDWGLDA